MSIYTKNIVSLDIETTDIDPAKGKIIEIAAVRFCDGHEVEHFQQLIDPGIEVPSFVTALTGITTADVTGQPRFSEIKQALQDFIGGDPIVGHNIYFDINFIAAEGLTVNNLLFDTWQLATMLVMNVASHSLETLAEHFSIAFPESHRALNDASVSAKLFYTLLAKLADVSLENLTQIVTVSQKGEWPLRTLFESAAEQAKNSKQSANKNKVPKRVKKTVGAGPDKLAQLEEIFAQKGPLKKALPNYELRASQVKLTKFIAEELVTGQHALIEAEPGVGRTLGYLLPLAYYTEHQKARACIVPYSQELLEQLFYHDLPIVQAVTPFSLKTAILRKPGHYLCGRRLAKFMSQKTLTTDEINLIVKIILWQENAREGIFEEMVLTNQERTITAEINGTQALCRAGQCKTPAGMPCFYNRARKKAQTAQLLFLNQTALIAENDFTRRNLTTSAEVILFDEANHLEEALTRQLGVAIHQNMLYEYLAEWSADFPKAGVLTEISKIQRAARKQSKKSVSVPDLKEVWQHLEEQTTLWLGLVGLFFRQHVKRSGFYVDRLVLDENLRGEAEWSRIKSSAQALFKQYQDFFTAVTQAGQEIKQQNPALCLEIEALCATGAELLEQLNIVVAKASAELAVWLTINDRAELTFRSAPIALDDYLSKNYYEKYAHVFVVGASLTADNKFDYMRGRLGLPGMGVKEIRIPTPYAYQEQMLVIIPNDVQLPSKPGHHEDVAEVVSASALALQGKTVALFTSVAAARAVYDRIAPKLQAAGINVVGQGVTGGYGKVLAKFLSGEPAVLLATGNMWESLDISGEALSALVIAKMPFEVPSDPVYAAREKDYDNRFMDFAIPQAIIRFKQGAQRLLRQPKDRGVMIIMDKRLNSEEYGLAFLRSLPAVGVESASKQAVPEIIKNFFNLK